MKVRLGHYVKQNAPCNSEDGTHNEPLSNVRQHGGWGKGERDLASRVCIKEISIAGFNEDLSSLSLSTSVISSEHLSNRISTVG